MDQAVRADAGAARPTKRGECIIHVLGVIGRLLDDAAVSGLNRGLAAPGGPEELAELLRLVYRIDPGLRAELLARLRRWPGVRIRD